tara:strand:- start:220 stop:375 length:156 start_codon:yes stop_codon:yes gene_type:complete
MNKILAVVCVFSFTTAPVLGLGEGGCSLSKKNKAIKDETIEQVYSSYSDDR